MQNDDDKIVQSLIAEGIIGAALGFFLTTDEEKDAKLSVLARAAILATYTANEQAKQTKQPFYIEEQGDLFEIQPNGQKKFIRKVEKPLVRLRSSFKLKH